ncbi:MAG: branched-chain amino acid aminotransferase [Mucinivorans sp.]
MKRPEEIDFMNLPFGYVQTPWNLRVKCTKGEWGAIEKSQDENVSIHMASSGLHYGQQAFEGLKAFRGKDGQVRVFRMCENAKRLQRSAQYLRMAEPSVELFEEMVRQIVTLNIDYVPPVEADGSLYIRPVLFGVGPRVGVSPSDDYLLLLFVTPVGAYYKGGMQGIRAIVDRAHDRASSHGTGHIKAGGNYGSSLLSGEMAHEAGYQSVLYLDPTEHRYIDECGAANFFGIKDGKYITPASPSVLPSITNMSLQQLAQDMGLTVEKRAIDFKAEIASFHEAGACGTAAVITPIASITDPHDNQTYNFKTVGPVSQKLYDTYRGIQLGTLPDTHNWNTIIKGDC